MKKDNQIENGYNILILRKKLLFELTNNVEQTAVFFTQFLINNKYELLSSLKRGKRS